jgi:hypothetical protein
VTLSMPEHALAHPSRWRPSHALDRIIYRLGAGERAARPERSRPRLLSRAVADGRRTDAVIDELGADAEGYSVALTFGEPVRAGYLEETLGADQATGPLSSRLTEKGLQVTAGWPSASGEVALDRLLTVIEERIAASTSAEERSKWERPRDGVLGIGRDVFVHVLTASVNAAAKHVAG